MKLSKKKLQDLKSEKIQFENLNNRYFINSRDEAEVENILKLLNENICSFKDIVDKFKNIKDEEDDPCLYNLLENKELFEKLIDNKITKEDLRYLLNKIDKDYELRSLRDNILLKYIVDKGLFKELVDKFKNIKDSDDYPCLNYLLRNEEFLEELIENNLLDTEDTRYLLNRTDEAYELARLCTNTSLLMKVLNEFVLDKETVDKFDRIIENSNWYKNRNIYTVFDLIEYHNIKDKEILKLNKYVCSFELNDDQKLELSEVLRDNEIAQNRLIQIIDNNLQDQYDFESLKSLLTKDEKKKKTKLNF